jgi:hypothetical protein
LEDESNATEWKGVKVATAEDDDEHEDDYD